MKEENQGQQWLKWLGIFGAGLVVGILAAPKTGRGTRSWIGQKGERLRGDMGELGERARRRASFERGKLKGAMHKMSPTAPQEDVYIDDDLITQRVRTQIGENKLTAPIPRINVDTCDGIVTLRGATASDTEKEDLTEVASNVKDVKSVINKVTVLKKAQGA